MVSNAEVGHPSPVLFFCVFGIGNIKYEIVIIIATNETTLRMETFFLFSSSKFFPTTCGIRGGGKGWGQRGLVPTEILQKMDQKKKYKMPMCFEKCFTKVFLISSSPINPYVMMFWTIQIHDQRTAQRCVLPVSFLVWIYYCHSSNSTRKETGKTHLCGL